MQPRLITTKLELKMQWICSGGAELLLLEGVKPRGMSTWPGCIEESEQQLLLFRDLPPPCTHLAFAPSQGPPKLSVAPLSVDSTEVV